MLFYYLNHFTEYNLHEIKCTHFRHTLRYILTDVYIFVSLESFLVPLCSRSHHPFHEATTALLFVTIS